MADIRIKDLPTTATQTASDDFIALDGTVNGTRKIDASAPSFKTSVTSPSVVAPAATALTLTGGSTGASLVLGQGASAKGVFTGGSATGMTLDLVRTTGTTGPNATFAQINGYNGTANRAAIIDFTGAGAVDSGQVDFWTKATGTGIAQIARLTSTGNLLIGTTTDMTGSGGLKIAGTTASTGSTSGALQVAGGIYAGAASVFGSTVTAQGAILSPNTALFSADAALSSYSTTNGVYLNGHAAGWLRLAGSGGGAAQIQLNGGAAGAITMNTATANALVLNGSTGAATFAGAVSAQGTGAHTFGTTNTVSLNAGAITATNSTAGGTNNFLIRNLDNTNAASAAVIQATVGGANAGDPRVLLTVDAVVDWSLGVDNSDSDKFKIGPSGTVGTSTALTLTSAGAVSFAGTVSPQQATTAGAPAYVKGAIYFDTTLNKLRVGGATAWETITSV